MERACSVFALDHTSTRPESILKRLQHLIKRGMLRYNQEVEVFKNCLTNLSKIGDGIVLVILEGKEKLAL
jgi:hypothetical protein